MMSSTHAAVPKRVAPRIAWPWMPRCWSRHGLAPPSLQRLFTRSVLCGAYSHARPYTCHATPTLLWQAHQQRRRAGGVLSAQQRPGGWPRALSAAASADAGSAGRMLLVDALPVLYAGHYSFPPDSRLRNEEGEDTTCCYQLTQSLLALLREVQPSHACVVFDPTSGSVRSLPPGWTLPYLPNSTSLRSVTPAGGLPTLSGTGAAFKSWRHSLLADYKGSRKDQPPEVGAGAEMSQRLLDAAGLPYVEVAGVEADDIIATLATQAQAAGLSVVIASPDRDFHQLLSPTCHVWSPSRGQGAGPWKKHTAETFRAAHGGLEPWQHTHMKALTGDATDDIRGVAGIGPVLATQLLQRYTTLEAVLEQIQTPSELPVRARKPMAAPQAAHDARISFDLVTLRTDVHTATPVLQRPLDVYARASGAGGSRRHVLEAVKAEYAFKSISDTEIDLLLWE